MIPMFPIPVPPGGEGVPPVFGPLFALAGLALFVVLVWQAVRYFRNNRDDRDGDDQ